VTGLRYTQGEASVKRGFFLHVALTLSSNELRMPYGVLALKTHTRGKPKAVKSLQTAEARAQPRSEKESA
jgi:hypothetical protein